MPGYQFWNQPLVTQIADGTAVANTVTETSLLNAGAVFTIPANYLIVGTTLSFWLTGRVSNTGTPTLRLLIRYGAVGSGVILADTTALSTGTGLTTNTWMWWGHMVVRSIGGGTSATVFPVSMLSGITGASAQVEVPASAPAVSSGFDSTTATQINVSAIWGTASASNTITAHQFNLWTD